METAYLITAVSALAAVVGVQWKAIVTLWKKAETRGDRLIEMAENLAKGEYCEGCKFKKA